MAGDFSFYTKTQFYRFTSVKKALLIFILCFLFDNLQSQTKKVYLFPGQGSDAALFSKMKLLNCDTTIISYPAPLKKESLQAYAKRISTQIDTTKPFYLIGVSFGGMLSVEISKFLNPQKVILISSAAIRKELPFRYIFQKVFPLYTIFSGRYYKRMANLARPIVEPDCRIYDSLFSAMIDRKDPKFMKRSIKMICRWDNKMTPKNVVHLHGNSDHTLPYRRIKNAIKVEKGSHMMVYTKAEEINELVNKELER